MSLTVRPELSGRRGIWLLALVVLTGSWMPLAGSGHDDIWIYIQSAKTILESGSFLNVNGARQIAVTSWLLTLLGVPVVWLTQDSGLWIWLAWKAFTLALYLLGLALLLRQLDRSAGWQAVVYVAVLLWAFPSVGSWAWGGLDSGLFLLGAIAFALSLERLRATPHRAGTLIMAWVAGLAFCFSRTDVLWGFLLPAFLASLSGGKSARWAQLKLSVMLFAAVALSVAVTLYWTGQPVPNPAIVKAGVGLQALRDGVDYWRQWYGQSPGHLLTLLLWPACGLIIVLRLAGRPVSGLAVTLSCIAMAMDLASVVTGGDWMGQFRFATRTLELKLAAVVIAWPDLARPDRMSHASAAAWLGVFLGLVLSAGSADGIVKARRGIIAVPTGQPADWVSLLDKGSDGLVSWNSALDRDMSGIVAYLDSGDWSRRLEMASAAGRPLVVASYQAGFFVYELQRHAAGSVVFLDMAGLTDYRLAEPRGQERTALGISAGVLQWATSLRDSVGPIGAAGACVPELLYVLTATARQRRIMLEADYEPVWDRPGAVVFARRGSYEYPTWIDCRSLAD